MADSIFDGHGNFQPPTLAEFFDGRRVARDVPVALHVDLSAAMVHVADLLRFRGRHGDFYFLDGRGSFVDVDEKIHVCGKFDVRAEFFLLDNPAGRAGLLLHDVALSVAGVADGTLHDELARGD